MSKNNGKERRIKRHEDAEEALIDRNARTTKQQLADLAKRPGKSKRETERLTGARK